jgi:malonate transporter and related proteins
MIDVLLGGVLPIFAIAAIGYVLGMRGVFDPASAAAINKFVFMIGIPALSFRLIVNAPFADFDWLLLVGFFFSELCVYFIGFLFAWKLLKCELKEAILLGLAAAFGNHILFVLPIAVNLFGEHATVPIVAIISLDSIVIFGGTMVIMEAITAKDFSFPVLAKKIFQNPPLVSMMAGILVAFLAVDIPKGVNAFLSFAGNVAAPCALFSLGIILSQTKLSERLVASSAVSALKLIGHPIIAWVILMGIFGFTLGEAKSSMMVAAAPCGAMAFVLALTYQVRTDAIAPAILFTTVGSLLSVTITASL